MFATPRLHRFKIPESRMFAIPRLHRFKIPENRMFAIPRLRRFKIPENRECFAPEKHILRISLNSTFRGWRVHYKNLVDTWRFALVIDRQKSVMVNYLWRFKNLLQNHRHNFAKSGKPSQTGCNYDTSNRHGPWDPWVSWQQAMTKWNVMGRFHVSAAMSVLWGGTWLPRHLANWAHLFYLAWAQIQSTTAAQYSFFGYWAMIHFARPTTA
jgi:hypothetical protein